MKSSSPLRYPGGKAKIYKFIKHLIGVNGSTTYIEPFAGGAGVAIALLLNNDVKKIIINDYDKSIYSFWYSVVYRSEELIEKIRNCDITIDEWYKQKEIQEAKKDVDDLTLGFSTLFLNRTNRSGIIKGGVIGGKEQKGNYKLNCRFNKDDIIQKIKLISSKKKYIKIYNMDATEFIDEVIKKTRNSFIFFDPPYYEKGPSLYTNFYTKKDHIELAKKIQTDLKNRKWIVTYDHNDEIKKLYANLNYLEYYLTYSAQNKTKGIEYMFFSKKTKYNDPSKYLNVYNSSTL
ncbi:DNA adenine methylase [Parageobacillus galactosidasius]|uniref:site-specific DNA-methyltransferase (adenine-specific) n=1 Tax=Parageobacillus galactosidasius TaxID=883812 RepID=A0A226QQC0_9BACL|nr:DNA adenine methylase [Parageobacillus galactosidasius]OXB94671.1 DNA methyltransferase [Parageobacillus galactosidasius]